MSEAKDTQLIGITDNASAINSIDLPAGAPQSFAALVQASGLLPDELKGKAIDKISEDLVNRLLAIAEEQHAAFLAEDEEIVHQNKVYRSKPIGLQASPPQLDASQPLTLASLSGVPYFSLELVHCFQDELQGLLDRLNPCVVSIREASIDESQSDESYSFADVVRSQMNTHVCAMLTEQWNTFYLFFLIHQHRELAQHMLESLAFCAEKMDEDNPPLGMFRREVVAFRKREGKPTQGHE